MLIRYSSPKKTSPLTRRGADLLTQVAVLGVLWMFYRFARLVATGESARALRNAENVLRVERWLPLPSETILQQWALSWAPFVKVANLFYVTVHFPATVAFLAWVWARHRDALPRVRSVLIILTSTALALHALYPLAPPRLTAGYGFVDTGALFGPSPYRHGFSALVNQFAAMPSLHIGWAVLVGWTTYRLVRSWQAKALAVTHPVLTTLVVVVTANHYWLDGLAAIGLLGGAVAVTRRLEAKRHARRNRQAELAAASA